MKYRLLTIALFQYLITDTKISRFRYQVSVYRKYQKYQYRLDIDTDIGLQSIPIPIPVQSQKVSRYRYYRLDIDSIDQISSIWPVSTTVQLHVKTSIFTFEFWLSALGRIFNQTDREEISSQKTHFAAAGEKSCKVIMDDGRMCKIARNALTVLGF